MEEGDGVKNTYLKSNFKESLPKHILPFTMPFIHIISSCAMLFMEFSIKHVEGHTAQLSPYSR
jgi:hypothetical protein